MADRTGLVEFRADYEAKNGQIGSQDVLNKAVDKLKVEMDLLWDWSAGTSDTLPIGDISDTLIDDTVVFNDLPTAQSVVRSANYMGLRISNEPTNTGSLVDTWCTSQIYSQIQNAALDGGTW